jgi:hypothetical protein
VDAARAPFAAGLARLLPELVRLEELLPCPIRGDERRCHLDLDDVRGLRGVEWIV